MKLEQLLVMRIYNFLIILQIFAIVNTAHVNNSKIRILKEVKDTIANDEVAIHDVSNIRNGGSRRSLHIVSKSRHHHNRWNARHKIGSLFTRWTAWTKCDSTCKKSRERFCKVKRRCGFTKHIEEKLCPKLQCQKQRYTNIFSQHQLQLQPFIVPASISPTLPPIIQTSTPASQSQINSVKFKKRPTKHYHHKRHKLQVFEEIHNSDNNTSNDSNNDDDNDEDDESDFFVVKNRKYHKKRKPLLIEVEDYDELEDEDDSSGNGDHNSSSESYIFNKKFIKAIRTKKWRRNDKFSDKRNREGRRNLQYNDWDGDGIDYDYQSFTGVNYNNNNNDNEYNEDDYDDDSFDSKNFTKIPPRERAVYEMSPKHRRAYTKWSEWSKCTAKCTTRRYKKCRLKIICGKEVLREIAYCYTEGTFCQQWLQGQVQKNDVKPIPSNRKDIITTNNQNSIGGSDFIMNGKGYRGPEYQPLKLKCGIAPIRSNKRNMYNLLKIIGGKASRKGEWPWQVVIFNRFKEAFCGGTLIAPNWIVTAAHCVRKVLYVRLGEHNLDFDDGTEMEYRVVKSIRHPNYDKKTVDSDIALLRLPKPMNISTWIGYSCLPKPYQKLPKNIQCTVIGWGKRRNRDQAGTSVLHQAEVPIIPMENCKNVYHDYTITNNMFCAGHKRGRIDTCAGDSGGPLLCRDSTKPNHPWTIFGITSFGDGCAKRNKFGIYTKVPNYVDWIWSVVNCNGNCKQNSIQRKL